MPLFQECLYGDKDASCTTKTRADCRNAETEEMCCETCRDFQGDKGMCVGRET